MDEMYEIFRIIAYLKRLEVDKEESVLAAEI